MSKRKPKTQTGVASFTMNDLAELVTIVSAEDWLTKPKQNDIQKDTRTKHIRNIHTDKV
jgi:hypothetical protein